MTTYGYCRTSTRDQDLDHQIRLLRDEGCDEIHTEQLSGKDRKRPVLDYVLRKMKAGDTLKVTRLSRLARNVHDVLDITRDLDTRGCQFVVTQQQIDTRSPMGRFLFVVLAAVMELERELVADNVRDGMAAAKARGARIGRRRTLDGDREAELAAAAPHLPVPYLMRAFGLSRATVYRYVQRARKTAAGSQNPA